MTYEQYKERAALRKEKQQSISKPNYETESDNPVEAEKVSYVEDRQAFGKLTHAELKDYPRFATPSPAP